MPSAAAPTNTASCRWAAPLVGALTPLAGVAPLTSNSVTLTREPPAVQRLFQPRHRRDPGAEPWLNDHPSVDALTPHILDPNDPIRIRLMGQLQEGVTSLLARADKDGGTIHAALYELNDPNGLEKQLQANPNSRNVILGNEQSPDADDADADNRAALKAAGVNVIDRILGKGDIPHNKFLVLTENNAPTAVLSGSTNWTSTGLCTQTNNALVIEFEGRGAALPRLLERAEGRHRRRPRRQAASCNRRPCAISTTPTTTSRSPARSTSEAASPSKLMFSPNTPGKLAKNPDTPNDMERVFDLMDGAKQAVLFLAFDPGNNSILDEAGKAAGGKARSVRARRADQPAARREFLRSAACGRRYRAADDDGRPAAAGAVTVVGEPGQPKKKGAPAGRRIDFRAVPAGAVTRTTPSAPGKPNWRNTASRSFTTRSW